MVTQVIDEHNQRRKTLAHRRATLSIAGIPFATKKEAHAYTKQLIDRQTLNQYVQGPDHDFLCDLLTRHPHVNEKVGAGICYFWVRQDPAYPRSRQLVLHRVDGSDTAISWNACVTQRSTGHAETRALRNAVGDQVLNVKLATLRHPPVYCAKTLVPLTFETAHVDHEAPLEFGVLESLWLARESLTLAEIAVYEPSDQLGVRVMSNAQQRTSWQAFHAYYANLRVISIPANLTNRRKTTLVELGQWALAQGRDDLVELVTQAIQRERLGDA